MDDSCITEISAERFFHDIRAAAAVLRKGNLAGRHIGIMGCNSYGWLVSLCAVFLDGISCRASGPGNILWRT